MVERYLDLVKEKIEKEHYHIKNVNDKVNNFEEIVDL